MFVLNMKCHIFGGPIVLLLKLRVTLELMRASIYVFVELSEACRLWFL